MRNGYVLPILKQLYLYIYISKIIIFILYILYTLYTLYILYIPWGYRSLVSPWGHDDTVGGFVDIHKYTFIRIQILKNKNQIYIYIYTQISIIYMFI